MTTPHPASQGAMEIASSALKHHKACVGDMDCQCERLESVPVLALAIDAAVTVAVAAETERCAKIADERERCEVGFGLLARQSRDVQRESDFLEGAAIAKSIAAAIRDQCENGKHL